MYLLAFLNSVMSWDMVIILVIGLLLFGKRLPEVGRSLGRGIIEFKRGLKGVEDDIENQSSKPGNGYRDQLPAYRPPSSPQGEDLRVRHSETVQPGIDPTQGKSPTGD